MNCCVVIMCVVLCNQKESPLFRFLFLLSLSFCLTFCLSLSVSLYLLSLSPSRLLHFSSDLLRACTDYDCSGFVVFLALLKYSQRVFWLNVGSMIRWSSWKWFFNVYLHNVSLVFRGSVALANHSAVQLLDHLAKLFELVHFACVSVCLPLAHQHKHTHTRILKHSQMVHPPK